MVKKDLEAAGIPYTTKDGDADFHAAGRHSYITELITNGVSLVEAKELARHGDVRMTMRYTHIGLEDQAKAIKKLPANSSWRTGLPDVDAAGTNEESQHIRSKSGVSEGHSQSSSGTESHSSAATPVDVSACCDSPSGTHRQKKAPPVTGDALTEDTRVEPLCRNSEAVGTKGVTESENGVVAVWQRTDCVLCQELARMDTDLQYDIVSISRVWATLDSNVRAAILTLVGSS